MREIVGALLGIPATMAIAGGLGLMIVTVFLRIRPRPGKPPLRWAQFIFGFGMFGAGVALLGFDLGVVGLG